jgi:hypothetical protein
MSTSTGTPPCRITVLRVLTQVSEVVITFVARLQVQALQGDFLGGVALFITRQCGTWL